jgi:hypothetical protein
LYLTEFTNIIETSKAMAAAPPAQFLKDQEPVGFHGPPPPRYDEAMAQGHRMPYVPQPAAAPYPPHNGTEALKFTYVKQLMSVILTLFDTMFF